MEVELEPERHLQREEEMRENTACQEPAAELKENPAYNNKTTENDNDLYEDVDPNDQL